jgi:hypothetical protein
MMGKGEKKPCDFQINFTHQIHYYILKKSTFLIVYHEQHAENAKEKNKGSKCPEKTQNNHPGMKASLLRHHSMSHDNDCGPKWQYNGLLILGIFQNT